MEFNDLNEITLQKIINEVLSDKKYKKKAKEIEERFKDRPMDPLDTAIYWIEYVIRHKGADFVKNPALKMSWLEYTMLDVYAFIIIVIILIVVGIVKLLTLIISLVSKQNNNAVTKRSRQKKE